MICEYQGCENEAEWLDDSDSRICEDCMIREIIEGEPAENFESIDIFEIRLNGKE